MTLFWLVWIRKEMASILEALVRCMFQEVGKTPCKYLGVCHIHKIFRNQVLRCMADIPPKWKINYYILYFLSWRREHSNTWWYSSVQLTEYSAHGDLNLAHIPGNSKDCQSWEGQDQEKVLQLCQWVLWSSRPYGFGGFVGKRCHMRFSTNSSGRITTQALRILE